MPAADIVLMTDDVRQVFGVVGIVAGALIHNVGSVAVVVNEARLVSARIGADQSR